MSDKNAHENHDDRTEHGRWTPDVSREADRIMNDLGDALPEETAVDKTDKTRLNSPLRQKGTEDRED
ncbi:hypothetical protein [Deinococcus pimensis]|uniref:hypothetical protein n=1 Tax=Deinococcus pimensis TaxID=309888 RepID=UPI000483B1D5|nr:hypothetical protein [Deinococcus pimensis]